jgi:alcohol dehydrogenase YqhD (iron-dependent ADH family)
MVHERVLKQLSSNKSTDEMMEILLQNMTKTGKTLVSTSELDIVRSDLIKWSESKTFSGKIHFNLIDLVELMQAF